MTKGILYDLDGTLLDSYDRIVEGVLETFASFGKPVKREDCRPEVSWEWLCTKRDIDFQRFLQRYNELLMSAEEAIDREIIRPFPDTISTLEAMAEMGIKQAVITRKVREQEAGEMVDRFGLGRFLTGIYVTPASKQQYPDKRSEAADAILDMVPTRGVYIVGDSEPDDVGTGLVLKERLPIEVNVVFLDRWEKGTTKADYLIKEIGELVQVVKDPAYARQHYPKDTGRRMLSGN
ncbi:TPA: HAD family hydrolase [Candidatus Woesearchaeota archaeon]|nr:HAD family hydrolase [Candidatus Woesearchaeota archaeon]